MGGEKEGADFTLKCDNLHTDGWEIKSAMMWKWLERNVYLATAAELLETSWETCRNSHKLCNHQVTNDSQTILEQPEMKLDETRTTLKQSLDDFCMSFVNNVNGGSATI